MIAELVTAIAFAVTAAVIVVMAWREQDLRRRVERLEILETFDGDGS